VALDPLLDVGSSVTASVELAKSELGEDIRVILP